jgi:hypothetical protein
VVGHKILNGIILLERKINSVFVFNTYYFFVILSHGPSTAEMAAPTKPVRTCLVAIERATCKTEFPLVSADLATAIALTLDAGRGRGVRHISRGNPAETGRLGMLWTGLLGKEWPRVRQPGSACLVHRSRRET